MNHLEIELKQLNQAMIEMMQLVKKQVEKSKEAYLKMDTELAQEIIYTEKRVNALELSIDRNCENILALFNPLASNLRFVISIFKINSDLERIGDYANGISNYVLLNPKEIKPSLVEAVNLKEMFDITISMTQDIFKAFEKKDTKLARKVYKKDKELNLINQNAPQIISQYVKKEPESIEQALYLFSTIRKLERIGDHIKNIAEELIFHLEAEVIKHKKIS